MTEQGHIATVAQCSVVPQVSTTTPSLAATINPKLEPVTPTETKPCDFPVPVPLPTATSASPATMTITTDTNNYIAMEMQLSSTVDCDELREILGDNILITSGTENVGTLGIEPRQAEVSMTRLIQ